MVEKCCNKWEETGLLKGLEEDPELRRKIACLLENQAQYILRLAENPKHEKEMEENDNYRMALNVVFPVIRRIFAPTMGEPFNADWEVMTEPVGEWEGKKWYASTEKLATRFDAGLVLDISVYCNLSAEVELTVIVAEQLKAELEKKFAGRKVYVYVPIVMMGLGHEPYDETVHKYMLATRYADKSRTENIE